jgi:small-conductance mechanosensitive channel
MVLDLVISSLAQLLRVSGESYPVVFVALILWLFLFIFFSKMISNFSVFSNSVAWIMGLLLSFIAVFFGIASTIVLFLVGSIGFLGAILVILIIFVGYFIVQSLIERKLKADKEREDKRKEKIAKKVLRKFGGEITK